jgi:hypothetical protein
MFSRFVSRDPIAELSPLDNWIVELPLDLNPFLRTVTDQDELVPGLDAIEDIALMLEYELT